MSTLIVDADIVAYKLSTVSENQYVGIMMCGLYTQMKLNV